MRTERSLERGAVRVAPHVAVGEVGDGMWVRRTPHSPDSEREQQNGLGTDDGETQGPREGRVEVGQEGDDRVRPVGVRESPCHCHRKGGGNRQHGVAGELRGSRPVYGNAHQHEWNATENGRDDEHEVHLAGRIHVSLPCSTDSVRVVADPTTYQNRHWGQCDTDGDKLRPPSLDELKQLYYKSVRMSIPVVYWFAGCGAASRDGGRRWQHSNG
jgi:hypothetical protein